MMTMGAACGYAWLWRWWLEWTLYMLRLWLGFPPRRARVALYRRRYGWSEMIGWGNEAKWTLRMDPLSKVFYSIMRCLIKYYQHFTKTGRLMRM